MSFLVVLALSIFVAVKLLAYFYRVAVILSVFFSYRFFSALYYTKPLKTCSSHSSLLIIVHSNLLGLRCDCLTLEVICLANQTESYLYRV